MNTEYLKTLAAVVESGSFSRAQEQLYVSKQAIMQQINALEKAAGVPLLTRSAHGVALTQAGEAFYRGAQEMLHVEERTLRQTRAAGNPGKVLRLSNIDYHVLLTPVTDAYHKRYPSVELQRVMHPVTLEAHLVQQGIIDVGDTLYSPRYTQGSLCYQKLLDMPYFCIVPPGMEDTAPEQAINSLPVLADYREFSDYYSFHLRLLRKRFPQMEITHSRRRRVDIIYHAITSGKAVITASTFARQLPDLRILPLNFGFAQECGVVWRNDAGKEVLDYVALARTVYGM